MQSEELDLLRRLLEEQRILSLGVLVDGKPYVGLLPFVVRSDYSSLVIHASSLARHTRGLADGAPFAALIHASDRPELDPLQLPRLSLQGRVRQMRAEEPAWKASRDLYLEKYPSSRSVFQLGDFHLYELAVASGRLVAGFGRISTVPAAALAELAGSGSS